MFGVVANVKKCDTISRMATEYCSVDIKGVQVVWFCVLGSITHYTILIHACMCVLGSLTHYTILIHACMCVLGSLTHYTILIHACMCVNSQGFLSRLHAVHCNHLCD